MCNAVAVLKPCKGHADVQRRDAVIALVGGNRTGNLVQCPRSRCALGSRLMVIRVVHKPY